MRDPRRPPRIAADAASDDVRAHALWELGRLGEREADAAVERALAAYARVLAVSDTAFPKTLLEARMARLRKREADR